VVGHLLGIMALGKFFAEKVEAGKPEDVRVAVQSLGPSAQIGDKYPRQHQRDRHSWKDKSEPRAVKIVPHRS
jgi:hypothetical protein